MADACAAADCALLGGETAEMPGVYVPGAFDIAGTLIGVVERAALLPRTDLQRRRRARRPGVERPAHQRLLACCASCSTGCRWTPCRPAWTARSAKHSSNRIATTCRCSTRVLRTGKVKALAHITGGGLPENLPRVLPDSCDAVVQLDAWPVPPLFRLVREAATGFDVHELHRTLNMGIGMVIVCAAADLDAVQRTVSEPTWVIGELVPGSGKVHLQSGGDPTR